MYVCIYVCTSYTCDKYDHDHHVVIYFLMLMIMLVVEVAVSTAYQVDHFAVIIGMIIHCTHHNLSLIHI